MPLRALTAQLVFSVPFSRNNDMTPTIHAKAAESPTVKGAGTWSKHGLRKTLSFHGQASCERQRAAAPSSCIHGTPHDLVLHCCPLFSTTQARMVTFNYETHVYPGHSTSAIVISRGVGAPRSKKRPHRLRTRQRGNEHPRFESLSIIPHVSPAKDRTQDKSRTPVNLHSKFTTG